MTASQRAGRRGHRGDRPARACGGRRSRLCRGKHGRGDLDGGRGCRRPGQGHQGGPLSPCGVSFGAGQLYIADGGSVRQVNPGTDRLTTPAGTGVRGGPLGDGRRAARASLSSACGVAVDHSGNLVIADGRPRPDPGGGGRTGTFYGQAMTAGDIYTVAGERHRRVLRRRRPGHQGRTRPGPEGVAVDAAGNLVIADTGNQRIRVVAARTGTFYGQPMTAGDIYTVAGDGTAGSPATAARPPAPSSALRAGVAVDAAGNLLIADTGNDRIRVVAASTGTFYGQAMTAGDIYTVAGDGTGGFSGDGGPATSAELSDPEGVAVDAAGNLLIADTRQQPDPGGGGPHRHLLRAGDDRRGHLHHRRRRHRRVLRRRRPGHRGRAQQPGGRGGGRAGQPADRRHRQQPDPGGGGHAPARSTGRR